MLFQNSQQCLRPDGSPLMRMMLFPAADCTILDTWDSSGLRGTGSHDFTVTDAFVPDAYSVSFCDPPVQPGPLYAFPVIAAAVGGPTSVALGIARHAIDIVMGIAATKIATPARATMDQDATTQINVCLAPTCRAA